MANLEQIADLVLEREKGYVNDPDDKGGETVWGISKRSHPEMWKDGPPTRENAKEFYIRRYIVAQGFHKIPSTHAKLQEQLVDFGVNSGPQLAVQMLQTLLGVTADGVFGPKTLAAVIANDSRACNNALVKERCKMAGRIVQRDPRQAKFLVGWLSRFLSFLV